MQEGKNAKTAHIAENDQNDTAALAALIDAQLEEIVCGGFSRGTWSRVRPD